VAKRRQQRTGPVEPEFFLGIEERRGPQSPIELSEDDMAPAPAQPSSSRAFNLQIDYSDVVGLGVLLLAVGATCVAIVIAIGLVLGKVTEAAAVKIILGCVGGAAISGLASKLTVKPKTAEHVHKAIPPNNS
jgi:hypothetical protein